ncbi:putative ankyrin repeat protein [Eutypa lata UCREL1]|uniref:Putative ankyrin repeat protein n=1 Tax=Eutypa lata (strain UCR-EL1) TaxID=1287681 RepID=M7SWF9_EUTLA|nr:putative ankyrin repeat protein [Eutypa lata UCREL1]
MDPLSIIASVAQVTLFAGSLIQGISRFVVSYRALPNSIRELYDQLDTLQLALTAVQETFQKRPQQLPFERSHHENIHRIIQSCHSSLKELEHELPQLKDNTNALKKVCLSLEKSIKEDRIQEILAHVNTYTTILQLSLTTISLGSLWQTHESQEQIQAEIRKLTDRFRSVHIFSGRGGEIKDLSLQQLSIEADFEVINHEGGIGHDEKTVLDEEIRNWRKTADDVATAVSLNDLPVLAFDCSRSITPSASVSVDTLLAYEDDFDPEPDYKHKPSPDILEAFITANRDMVNNLMQSGIYLKAAEYQNRGIHLREQLSRAHDEPYPFDELADMKEKRADIFLECDSDDGDSEAKTILQQLLEKEVQRPAEQRSQPRRCRLYHKLGNLYLKQGNVGQARTFLDRAFEGRKNMDPRPDDLVAESAELLVKILQLSQAFDDARGLHEWIRQELRRTSTGGNVGVNLTKAYQWCRERGLDVDSPSFRFDVCDSISGTTPMHLAIQAEDIDVLRDMLSHVPHVEQLDTSSSTPLHQAAAMRNKYIVRLLIEERHATVNVLDSNGMSPLHRCQSAAGGIRVAELLLETCPQLVDCLDHFGKTALFMACEKGNEKMVRCLLAAHAKPNIAGPGGCTPLMATIEDVPQSARKIAIVELLLGSGADPGIQDRDGRTAFKVASNAGLAGSEIKNLLKKAAAVFPRRGSAMSVTTTIRSSVSGATGSSGSGSGSGSGFGSMEPSRSR